MNTNYYRALTIAGSDSGGGAGIQADLKTFSALGCYGMSVITAITAQNTYAVTGIHPVPLDIIAKQIDAVLEDIGADAVKIGMLHSAETIRLVAQRLRQHQINTIVVDPVMVAKSGDKLLQDEAIEALITELLPLATVITPNLPEAATLLNASILEFEQADHAGLEIICRQLARFGSHAVLLKGGHLRSAKSGDTLYLPEENRLFFFDGERIETPNTHGTGCTLSSAIAAYLAKGEEIPYAVASAKHYIAGAIQVGAAYHIGAGHGPLHHFYQWWK
ncbi:phosphomethylpyrimidine kinase [Candidatus Moduliflexus flocculans]|uniref:hydroxymethylpyrimidine kinase n=1 Tax=Candidatus Moduliflexus flocculans TaxID=1499966 RepID=A0A081BPB7_9BACT|nr:phosphomethylpyrimidine kinase [Candidatus Moduliflexus flocculans]